MVAKLSENSQQILAARYIDPADKTPDGMFDRVSMGNRDYFDVMRDLIFLPNSPTMMNLGLPYGGTLSACFVFDAQDTLLGDWPDGGMEQPFIDSILGTNFKAACVAKAGGGVGYYLGNIRPKGAPIRSTHKKACGPVTVLKYYHFLRSLITQGGRRDLAQMGVLPAEHPDIREFIHCKDADPQSLSSFNISVSWKNKMLKAIEWDRLGRDYYLTQPGVTNVKVSDETLLWMEQCQSAWGTGCPGNLFWDTINRFNATPHLGDINATNPCGETPNLSNEPCNLGSIAVSRLVRGVGKVAKFLWDELKHYVRLCTRFMDDILDANKFPHPDITKMAQATRKLGLGVMGWADLLALMHIPYDTAEAVDFGMELMKVINETALAESIQLAHNRGPYPAWETAPDEVKARFPWARNSTRTSIAPTGTIAVIAETWGSIEPHYAIECERTTNEGFKMNDGVPTWVKERLNNFAEFRPKTAKEVDWKWHIRHQAAFQKHTDLGVSKTINLPETATVKDVSDAYQMMWEMGCKGGTIFRENCRPEAVLVEKKATSVYSVGQAPVRRTLDDDEVPSVRHKFKVGGIKVYLHAGTHADGSLAEIFFRVSPGQGSTVDGMLDTFAKTFSKALQSGVPLKELVALHKNSRFEPNGFTGKKKIPHCTSIPDYTVRWLEQRFLPPAETVGTATNGATHGPRAFLTDVMRHSPADAAAILERATQPREHVPGVQCPECGGPMIRESNCLLCVRANCGFSRCG